MKVAIRFQVISVRPEAVVAEAAQLMLEHGISGLPVLDADGELVGIVTEGDLLRRAETGTERHHNWLEFLIALGRFTEDYVRAHAMNVHEVMSNQVVSVAPDDTFEKTVRLMERRGVKRLPVVEAGRVVGIIARADLVRALARNLAEPSNVLTTDAAIRDAIRAEIANQPWGPASRRGGVGIRWDYRPLRLHPGRGGTDGAAGAGREHSGGQSGAKPSRLGRTRVRPLCLGR